MKKYLVQAIHTEPTTGRQTIFNSINADDHKAALEYLMRKHRSNSNITYNVMDLETQEIITRTTRNIFLRAW